jgi:hypothetical protein
MDEPNTYLGPLVKSICMYNIMLLVEEYINWKRSMLFIHSSYLSPTPQLERQSGLNHLPIWALTNVKKLGHDILMLGHLKGTGSRDRINFLQK